MASTDTTLVILLNSSFPNIPPSQQGSKRALISFHLLPEVGRPLCAQHLHWLQCRCHAMNYARKNERPAICTLLLLLAFSFKACIDFPRSSMKQLKSAAVIQLKIIFLGCEKCFDIISIRFPAVWRGVFGEPELFVRTKIWSVCSQSWLFLIPIWRLGDRKNPSTLPFLYI